MSLGERLRRYRERAGLTQEELAARAGLTAKAISALERGDRRSPYPHTVRALADALGLSAAERAELLQARLPTRQDAADMPLPSQLAPPAKTTSLPIYFTPFIGRDQEQARLLRLLATPQCRLTTVIGIGGIGKTRLAVEVARQSALFADGVFFVALAPISEPQAIVTAIADSFGFTGSANSELLAQLLSHVRNKELLLVLDNMEHLLDSRGVVAGLLGQILAGAPRVKLLTTSRERLNMQAEWVIEIEGLPIPPNNPDHELADYPAYSLFLAHARRVQSELRLLADDERAIVQICRAMGGMPLGIELAAAWATTLSCGEIAAEIRRGLDFLERSDRDTPHRHRSMRVVFEHSWQLLTENERTLLARVAIFRGGFTREAAMFVTRMSLPQLASLVQKSLVRWSGAQRYDLHEVIRRFAAEKLDRMPDAASTRQRFFDYYLAMSAEASQSFMDYGDRRGYDALTPEIDNLRLALRQAVGQRQAEPGARLNSALRLFWVLQSLYREGVAWSEQLLGLADLSDAARGDLLNTISYLARASGVLDRARSAAEDALIAHRRSGDEEGLAWAVGNLAQILLTTGEYTQARALHQECVTLRRAVSGPHTLAWGYIMLVIAELLLHDREAAQQHHAEALALARSIEDRFTEGGAYNYYGLGLTLLGDRAGLAAATRALDLLSEPVYPWGLTIALEVLAAQAGMRGQHHAAGQLAGGAQHLRRQHQITATAIYRGDYERLTILARGALDDQSWDLAQRQGAGLTLAELLVLAWQL